MSAERKDLVAADHAVEVISSALKNVESRLYEEWISKVREAQLEVAMRFKSDEAKLVVDKPDFGRDAMTLVADAIVELAVQSLKSARRQGVPA